MEKQIARVVAHEIGIELIEVEQDDLGTPEYVTNGVSRCYFCRNNLAQAIQPICDRLLLEICVDGTHVDDMKTPRPGIEDLSAKPVLGRLTSSWEWERILSESTARFVGLSNSERPNEACLSSRIAFGQKIDLKTLRKIETAENAVRLITSASIVRVRTIGTSASVEVDKSTVVTAIERKEEIIRALRNLGYDTVKIRSKWIYFRQDAGSCSQKRTRERRL